eukprot:3710154-Lingulodinium_polyedra.AAC.1
MDWNGSTKDLVYLLCNGLPLQWTERLSNGLTLRTLRWAVSTIDWASRPFKPQCDRPIDATLQLTGPH